MTPKRQQRKSPLDRVREFAAECDSRRLKWSSPLRKIELSSTAFRELMREGFMRKFQTYTDRVLDRECVTVLGVKVVRRKVLTRPSSSLPLGSTIRELFAEEPRRLASRIGPDERYVGVPIGFAADPAAITTAANLSGSLTVIPERKPAPKAKPVAPAPVVQAARQARRFDFK